MMASMLLSLREGLEAALILGIVLGVLNKLNRSHLNSTVWGGAGVAVLLSLVAALGLNRLGLQFEGRGEAIFEAVAMLLAAAVLTWMILWVHRSSRNLKGEIEEKTREALGAGKRSGLFTLAFLAVFREGIELALFLLAVEKTSSPLDTLLGALAGLAGAGVLGWMLFSTTRRLNLRGFFLVTNVLLIVFAGGLVAVGVHELNEAAIIPALVDPLWDVNWILSDKSELGLLLKALVGYNGNPSLTEVIAYLTYITGIVAVVLSRKPKATAPRVQVAVE